MAPNGWPFRRHSIDENNVSNENMLNKCFKYFYMNSILWDLIDNRKIFYLFNGCVWNRGGFFFSSFIWHSFLLNLRQLDLKSRLMRYLTDQLKKKIHFVSMQKSSGWLKTAMNPQCVFLIINFFFFLFTVWCFFFFLL